MTKAWVSDAYRRIVVLGKQIHGGYGVISEYDLQLYLRRQQSDELFMGDADFYRGRIANVILCSQV
jgi:alkylation response protein AidB-like acyl-CoA dehydrogenase